MDSGTWMPRSTGVPFLPAITRPPRSWGRSFRSAARSVFSCAVFGICPRGISCGRRTARATLALVFVYSAHLHCCGAAQRSRGLLRSLSFGGNGTAEMNDEEARRWYHVPAYLELPEDARAQIVGIKRSEPATWVQFGEHAKRKSRTRGSLICALVGFWRCVGKPGRWLICCIAILAVMGGAVTVRSELISSGPRFARAPVLLP